MERLLDEVRWWVLEHGTAAVPQHALGRVDENGTVFPIGVRVAAIRSAFKAGRLSAAEAKMFASLPGWSWDYWDSQWRERLKEVAGRWRKGTLTRPDKAWLSRQRRRWDELRPEWRKEFDSHPRIFEAAQRSRVEDFIEACEQWLADHPGHTIYAMPYAATVIIDGTTITVGRRATYYRRRYRGLEGSRPLPSDEVERIESLPGWTWDMSESHVQAQQARRKNQGEVQSA